MTKELKAKLMGLTIDELDQWAKLNAQKEEACNIAPLLEEQLAHYRQLVIDLTNQMNDIVQKYFCGSQVCLTALPGPQSIVQ